MSVAWVLNLDADDELGSGRPRDVFAALERRPALEAPLAPLVGGGVVLRRGARAPAGAIGCAFCPTPSALAALVAAGAAPPSAPPVEVLRRVADRRFALALPGGVPGASILRGEGDAVRFASEAGEGGGGWVLRRLWSFAGRGRCLGRGPSLDEPARRFVARALRDDRALVGAPWLDRVVDLALHGTVGERGQVALGSATVQETTREGAWVASRIATPDDLEPGEAKQLRGLGFAAAAALAGAGYTGPFGVDALRARHATGTRLVRCELNPRFTMGWATGMGTAGL